MRQESRDKAERLFLYLVSIFKTSARVAMGHMENPVTNETEVNLEQASYYIDLLDMFQSKAKGNMSEYEEQMLINPVSELRMEFIKKKPSKVFDKKMTKDVSNGPLE